MQAKEKLITLCGLSKEETELDFSNQGLNAGDAVLIANDISDMRAGALAKFDISKNELNAGGCKAIVGALKGNSTLTELNVAETDMTYGEAWGDMSAVIALADAIPDMGAISSVNLLKNAIPVEQAQELVKTMQSKEKLTTLCGLSRNEVTLDFSNQGLGDGDAVLIANDISDMGALIKLDISNNYIEAEQKQDLQHICVAGGIELAK
jgi:hypothetical protein